MDDVEVTAVSPRYRNWWLAATTLLVAYVPVSFVIREGWLRWASLLLLALPAAILVEKWERLRLSAAGVTLRRWPRERTVAWDEIATVRLDWSGRVRTQVATPEITLRDGEVVRSGVLTGVTPRFGRGPERDALLERLHVEAAAHGFEVEVVPWRVP